MPSSRAQELIKVISSEGGFRAGSIQDGGGVGENAPGKTGSVTQNLAEGKY